jgi:hypothetical protein
MTLSLPFEQSMLKTYIAGLDIVDTIKTLNNSKIY